MKFKCKICNYSCSENYSGTHLKRVHLQTGREYYDKYIKEESDGVCAVCDNETSYHTIKKGYKVCCSRTCANKLRNIKLMKEYGLTNIFQMESVKEKIKETMLKKYGVSNISKLESIKQQKKKTLMTNYGVEFGLQNSKIKTKQESTMLKLYGVKQAMHVPELLSKAMKNGAGRCSAINYATKFGDEITIQGSYERKFVTLCELNNIRIINGPCIEYILGRKTHKYFVDFIIFNKESKQLVEIKSSYYFNKHKERCIAKKIAAIKWGKKNDFLDYVLLIDKIIIP